MPRSLGPIADHEAIRALYDAFNARDADAVIRALAADVRWPNGWEGGWLHGHDEVRDYWRRQWAEIDPRVDPVAIDQRDDGTVAVRVHQVVFDNSGNQVADTHVIHAYRFDGGLIAEMTIEEA